MSSNAFRDEYDEQVDRFNPFIRLSDMTWYEKARFYFKAWYRPALYFIGSTITVIGIFWLLMLLSVAFNPAYN